MIYYDPENYAECFIDEYGGYHVEEGFPKGYAGRNVLKGQSVINALQRTNEVNSGEGVDGAEKTAKRKRGCRAGKHKRNRLLKVCLCVLFYASMLLSSWSHSKGWKKKFSITPLIFLLQVCAAAVRDNKAAAVAAEQRHQVEETFGWGVLYCACVNIWEFFSWKNSISFFIFKTIISLFISTHEPGTRKTSTSHHFVHLEQWHTLIPSIPLLNILPWDCQMTIERGKCDERKFSV